MNIRFIPTRLHAVLDYATGASLLALPTVLRLDTSTASARATRGWGVIATVSGLVTKHELGVWRVLPMRAHLAADAAGGALLAAIPLVTGETRSETRNWLPPVVAGAMEILLALTTETDSRQR